MKTKRLLTLVLILALALTSSGAMAAKATKVKTSVGTLSLTAHKELGKLEAASFFVEGLAPVRVNGKWGYLNTDAQWQIQPQYDGASLFDSGYASVLKNGRWGCVDHDGKVVVDFIYEDMSNTYSDGLKAVCRNGKWGYIDTNGTEVLAPRWDRVRDFSEGLAAVKEGNTLGYINTSGEYEIVLSDAAEVKLASDSKSYEGGNRWQGSGNIGSWEDLGDFCDGLAVIISNDHYIYINHAGDIVLDRGNYISIGFTEGQAIFMDPETGLCGFIDTEGNVTIEPQWTGGYGFEEGISPVCKTVKKKTLWGFVDKDGKEIGKFQWLQTYNFLNGTAIVMNTKGKVGLVDTKGKTVLKAEWNYLTDFNEGYALGSKGNVIYLIRNNTVLD